MALNLDTLGLSATVTAEGISAPDYQTILSKVTGYFQQIYGTDAYLEPDSKDGQMVALVALAIHDANNTAFDVYNSFSPSTAMSDALSRNVKINGIARKPATRSTADLSLTGTAGTTITNGSARDDNGVVWNLPASVTIGTDNAVIATATCANTGAVAAVAGSINQINTPTRGWTAVTNLQAAAIGTPAENDTQLRTRQGQSVANASISPFDALDGAIGGISGVTRHKLYENDTKVIDSNGIPGNSVAAIIEGGDVVEIAQTLRAKKGQGVTTYGEIFNEVLDSYGNPHKIYFSRPEDVPVYVRITIKVFTGYTSLVADEIRTAVANYINSLKIGDDVLLSRMYSPANLGVVSGGNSKFYDINELLIGKAADSVAAANIDIAFSESATCSIDNVLIAVSA